MNVVLQSKCSINVKCNIKNMITDYSGGIFQYKTWKKIRTEIETHEGDKDIFTLNRPESLMPSGPAAFLVLTQRRPDVMLCDDDRWSLSDDVTILSCQAVVSISCLANLEVGVELVQLVGLVTC